METILSRCCDTIDAVAKWEIPKVAWEKCKGVAIINVTEVGFVFSMAEGDGVLIKHNDDGTWGAPSALSFAGSSGGAVFGKGNKRILLFPMTNHGLKLLCSKTKYDLGAQAGVALGPFGREAQLDVGAGGTGVEITWSYVFEDGAFLNVGINNYFTSVVPSINQSFYGKMMDPIDLVMHGAATAPEGKGVEEIHAKLSELAHGK